MTKILEYGAQCLREEAKAVEDLVTLLDQNFEQAVEMMLHCKGKIIVTGVGLLLYFHENMCV